MIRCLVIEDEIPAQNIIKHYINKLPNLTLITCFNSAVEARYYLNTEDVDLVFLDINLPELSGLDFIKTIDKPPAIIMTTAYLDYAVESYELPTIVDYLVKPFSFERFIKAINKAEKWITPSLTKSGEHLSETNAFIFINVDKTIHKIFLQDIKYIESDKNYVTIVTTKTKFSYLESLKHLETQLPTTDFLRVHKSYIVNHNFISKISGNIVFIESEKVPIGRTYKSDFMTSLKLNL